MYKWWIKVSSVWSTRCGYFGLTGGFGHWDLAERGFALQLRWPSWWCVCGSCAAGRVWSGGVHGGWLGWGCARFGWGCSTEFAVPLLKRKMTSWLQTSGAGGSWWAPIWAVLCQLMVMLGTSCIVDWRLHLVGATYSWWCAVAIDHMRSLLAPLHHSPLGYHCLLPIASHFSAHIGSRVWGSSLKGLVVPLRESGLGVGDKPWHGVLFDRASWKLSGSQSLQQAGIGLSWEERGTKSHSMSKPAATGRTNSATLFGSWYRWFPPFQTAKYLSQYAILQYPKHQWNTRTLEFSKIHEHPRYQKLPNVQCTSFPGK